MYEGSPARLVLGGVLIAALAAGLAWTLWGIRADSRAAPATSPPATPTTPPSASPSANPSPSSAPAGPATGDYAELATSAELEHPDTDPHIARWYRRFGFYVGEERDVPMGEWANKSLLWDSIAPALREEAMSLGSAFNVPLYDGDTAQPAVAVVRWSTADTEGLGELVDIRVTYRSTDGFVMQRTWPVLIRVHEDHHGQVVARLKPYEVRVTEYEDFASLLRATAERSWSRVVEYRGQQFGEGAP